VLLSGDMLLIKPDQMAMFSALNRISGVSPTGTVAITRFAP
jgi:hypothetical protein